MPTGFSRRRAASSSLERDAAGTGFVAAQRQARRPVLRPGAARRRAVPPARRSAHWPARGRSWRARASAPKRSGKAASMRPRRIVARVGEAPPVEIATTTSSRSTIAGRMKSLSAGRSATLTGTPAALAACWASMSRFEIAGGDEHGGGAPQIRRRTPFRPGRRRRRPSAPDRRAGRPQAPRPRPPPGGPSRSKNSGRCFTTPAPRRPTLRASIARPWAMETARASLGSYANSRSIFFFRSGNSSHIRHERVSRRFSPHTANSSARTRQEENFSLLRSFFDPLEGRPALPKSRPVSRAHPGAATSDIAQQEDD